jgi:low affinity Fe/Cu permease
MMTWPLFAAWLGVKKHVRGETLVRGKLMDTIRSLLTRLGELMATPAAFGVLLAFFCLWLIFDRDSLDWHAVATCATLAMTLLIQRTEHRDTQALQAKVDELLRAIGKAKNELTQIDREEPEEIEEHRKQTKQV